MNARVNGFRQEISVDAGFKVFMTCINSQFLAVPHHSWLGVFLLVSFYYTRIEYFLSSIETHNF
jgi:hypothetical protein